MAEFVTTDKLHHVNVASVAYTTSRKNEEKRWTTVLWSATDHELGTCYDFDPDKYAPIVPASPGQEVVVVYVTDGEVWSERCQVVAWRISTKCSIPVLIDEPDSNGTILIPLLGGKWMIQWDRSFDTIEDAVKYILETE
jgi:hypothetical protein